MVVIRAQYKGQSKTDTLNARVRIEDKRLVVQGGELVFYDAAGNLIKTDNGATELKFRPDGTAYYISGVLPFNNGRGDAYAKDGIDVRSAFS